MTNNLGFLSNLAESISATKLVEQSAMITKVTGRIIHAPLNSVKIGELCELGRGHPKMYAEVIGLDHDGAKLAPIGDVEGLSRNTEVIPTGKALEIPLSDDLLGKVIDGMGQPFAGQDMTIRPERHSGILGEPLSPLKRRPIRSAVTTGIKAIDSLLTVGEGQRVGIFAGSGVGKSTLMSELVKGADVDIVVCAMIGERGREVGDFLEHGLGEEGRKKSVVVAATSDRPPMERIKAAYIALTIAEYFRDKGKRVLLLMDSVTRFARALREIGLPAGEPPTRRGFPPSVFATLPFIVERAGNTAEGSITAFYTVLVEGDDLSDPIADEMRSLLDGHIVLSRKLAEKGHYPAIDIGQSISRLMGTLADRYHQKSANRFRELLAKYAELELLINIGEYQEGSNALADEAISKIDELNSFLKQEIDENHEMHESIQKLSMLVDA